MAFRARDLREGTSLEELRRELNEIQRALESDLVALRAQSPVTSLITASTYNASYGQIIRCAPPSGGLRLILPAVNLAVPSARVVAIVEAASGALSVEAINSTVNGATSLAYLAGIGLVEFLLSPTGWFAWSVSLVNDLPLTALADQTAESFNGNFTASAAPPTARAGSSVAGAGLTYTAGGTLAVGAGHAISVAADAVAVDPAALRGIGLTVVGGATGVLSTRQRPRLAQLQDYFASGDATTGQIGALGWNLLGSAGGGYARQNVSVMGSSTRAALTTGVALNDRVCLTLGETEARDVTPASDVTLLQGAWNHDNNLTTKRAFFGMLGTFANDPAGAVDCLGIYYDSAVSANYQIIARSSSSGSPTDTGVAVPANTAELITIHQHSAGSYRFYSGNTLLGTIASGIPTAGMNVGFRLENLTTVTFETLNIGYFGLEATAGNAFDDDAFLEA